MPLRKSIKSRKRGARLESLNDNQQQFVLELLANNLFSPTEAARKVGYKNPAQAANKLMRNKTVQALLGKEKGDRETRTRISSDDVWSYLHRVLDFDPLQILNQRQDGWLTLKALEKIPLELRQMIEEIQTSIVVIDGEPVQCHKVKFVPKSKALDIAARHAIPQEHEHKHDHVMKVNLDDLLVSSEGEYDDIEGEIARIEVMEVDSA